MENGNKSKVYTYLLVAFFAIFVATGLFVGLGAKKSQNETNKQEEMASTSAKQEEQSTLKQENLVMPTIAPTDGTISLTGKESYGLSETVAIDLEAGSSGKNIVGYDVIVFYDPLSFDLVEAKSALPDFTVYTYNRGNYLLLTAVKSLSSTTATVLGTDKTNQKIATITLKPKKAGKFNFSLRNSAGSDKTDLVTDQTEVMYPAMKDLTVEIK